MNLNTVLLLLVSAAFGALSLVAIAEHGYIGIFTNLFQNSAGWQALADLGIACGLIMVWMVGDARAKGRTAWPYLVLTLAAGSVGPLLYLLVGQFSGAKARHALA